jgi:uncharacterized membrane protein
VVRAFLLHPHVAGVIIGELDDQHALVFGQRRGDLLDQFLLALDVDRREQLVRRTTARAGARRRAPVSRRTDPPVR